MTSFHTAILMHNNAMFQTVQLKLCLKAMVIFRVVSFVNSFFQSFHLWIHFSKYANALVIMHAYILWFIHNTQAHKRQSTWKSNYISSTETSFAQIQSAKMHRLFNQLRLQISGYWQHIAFFRKEQGLHINVLMDLAKSVQTSHAVIRAVNLLQVITLAPLKAAIKSLVDLILYSNY